MASGIILRQCLRQFSRSHFFGTIVTPSNWSPALISKTADVTGRFFVTRDFAAKAGGEKATEGEAGAEESGDGSENLPERVSSKDRSRVIPLETSMDYIESSAYEQTYGNEPIWVKYRRNFKGAWAPKTRKMCIRAGLLSTGNPCPICRDEYLVLDYRNVKLLKQFISPYNGEILSTTKTGLCQKRQKELLVAICKAKDYGLISFDVPLRDYDYSDYHQMKQ